MSNYTMLMNCFISDKIGNDSKVSNEIGGAAKADQVRLLAAKNVARPQVHFKDKIDNSLNPFMPR